MNSLPNGNSYTPAKRKFSAIYWNQPVCPSICVQNTLRDSSSLDCTKFKAFAYDKLNVAEIMISVFDSLENILAKGENAAYQSITAWQSTRLFPCMHNISKYKSITQIMQKGGMMHTHLTKV